MTRTSAIKPPRLLSLDVLRGMTVAVMILVNNAGDGAVSYAQLRHSVWNGFTLTDVVFPLFLFIVGASIVLSVGARVRRGDARGRIVRQVLQRALSIFALGLLLNALPRFHLGELRYYGVLQRIALCYALGSFVYLYTGVKGCIVTAVLAVIGYWILLTHVPVPGYGMPGMSVAVLDPHGNLASWLDRLLVPQAHLYRHSFYDPEGALSTVSALATTLFGSLAAIWLHTSRTVRQRAIALLAAGGVLLAVGLTWSRWLPLNKRLWTSSFALLTAGIGMCLLALLFWGIDGRSSEPQVQRRLLKPWLVFGTNALAAYVLSEVLAVLLAAIPVGHGSNLQRLLFGLLPQGIGSPPFVSMVYSILFVGVCYLPIWELYRRRIFVKL